MTPITITDVRAVSGDGAFLLDDGKTAILYDTGFGFTGCKIAENIQKALGTRSLDYILLTHSHYDHVLATPYITSVYPNAKVIAGEYAAQIFQRPSAKAVMRELNRKAAAKHAMTDYEDLIDHLKVDITVKDGDRFSCGDFHFEAIALPGHTKCSMGFYLPEHKFLLGSETLGVYFGNSTYLPFFLVGYQLTLDAFEKVRKLEIEKFLLPHYGVVDREEARVYLENSEAATRETAQTMLSMLQEGKTKDEILAFFEERDYLDNVKPTYPIDAFHLNTSIMIEQIRKELLMNNK